MRQRIARRPCTIDSFRLGDVLLDAHSRNAVQKVQTKHHGKLGFVVVPEVGKALGMIGYALEKHSDKPLIFRRNETTRVVLGVYGVSEAVPSACVPPIVVHEHVEALTGNHFSAIIAEVREAEVLGILREQKQLAQNRGFGLSLLTLYQALTGERHYKDVIKIRGILRRAYRFSLFLEACQHPEAKSDLAILGSELMRASPNLSFRQLRKLGYGRFPRSRDPVPEGSTADIDFI